MLSSKELSQLFRSFAAQTSKELLHHLHFHFNPIQAFMSLLDIWADISLVASSMSTEACDFVLT